MDDLRGLCVDDGAADDGRRESRNEIRRLTAAVRPPGGRPPESDLPAWRLALAMLDNPLEAWPRALYEAPWHEVRAPFSKRRIVFAMDPAAIREITLEKAAAFEKGPIAQRKLSPMLGQGLLTAEGEAWKWQHRAAVPLFRPAGVAKLVPAMAAAAEAQLERWRDLGEDPTVDLNRDMMRATLEAVLTTLVARDEATDLDRVVGAAADYLDALGGVTLADILGAPSWLRKALAPRGERAVRYVRGEVGRLVVRRRGEPPREDLVAALLEAKDPETGRAMTDLEILDNVLTFIAAGHETTAVALMWSLYLLGLSPEVQARVREEALGAAGDGRIEARHLSALGFTRQVVLEAMRLYPPVGAISRAARDEVVIAGRTLAPGTQLIVPIYAVHRHRALWAEPELFRPERFAPETGLERAKFQYLPFGAGVRVCIGAGFGLTEAIVMLATFVRGAELAAPGAQSVRPVLKISLRPEGGMPMRLRLRPPPRRRQAAA